MLPEVNLDEQLPFLDVIAYIDIALVDIAAGTRKQNSLSTQQLQKVAWSEQDQRDFWTQQEDR